MVQLGGVAEGTARLAVKASKLHRVPGDHRERSRARGGAVHRPGHVRRSSPALAIDEANELSDADTADIFTEISRGVDKWLWFVEAHLQSNR